MLAKPTERPEPDSTGIQRTDIHLVLMARAGEMLVQSRKGSICVMTQVTFITRAIPSPRCSKKFALLAGITSRDHAGRISNDVIPVILTNDAINAIAVYARRARS